MRAHIITTALVLGFVATLTPAPAAAGVDWFGIGVSTGGFSFSLGYNDYPEYSDAWNNPSWAMNYNQMLDGYGDWVYVAGLGQVWHPYVAAQWRPFTYGRWAWTSLGWTWVSYEPWGYLPHHYGDWAFTTFGWVWVPGYTYRAANVAWFTGGSMVGWMPYAPRGWSNAHRAFRHGYDRGYRNGYGDGYSDGWRDARYATWVDWRHMGSDNVASYAYSAQAIERQARGANLRQVTVPDRREVERRAGARVPEVSISRRDVRMGDRTVQAVRVNGLDRDVQRHARDTVNRGLAPQVARQLERRAPVTRSVPGSASHGLTLERSRPNAPSTVSERAPQLVEPGRTEPGRVNERAPSAGSPPATISSRSGALRTPAAPVSRQPAASPSMSSRSDLTSRRQPIPVYRPAPVAASPSRAPVTRAPQPVQRQEISRSVAQRTAPRAVTPAGARSNVTSRPVTRNFEIQAPRTSSPRSTSSSRVGASPRTTEPSAAVPGRAASRAKAERSPSTREVRRPSRNRH